MSDLFGNHIVGFPTRRLKYGLIHHCYSADCCHQTATIQVVDDAGNVASCSPNISQNFKPPDPSHCNVSNTKSLLFEIEIA